MRTGKKGSAASRGALLRRTRAAAKYGMLSNSLFMGKEAFRESPVVLVITMMQALLAVACSVLELYVTPTILGILERHSVKGGSFLAPSAFLRWPAWLFMLFLTIWIKIR